MAGAITTASAAHHPRAALFVTHSSSTSSPFASRSICSSSASRSSSCGAVVEPHGIRGLIIHAAGKELVRQIDISSFIDQAMHYGRFWSLVAGANRTRPHLLLRTRLLYKARLFDYARDVSATAEQNEDEGVP